MPTVDVSGLPIERVVIALFENVYRKSEVSQNVWEILADRIFYQGMKTPVGMDRPPTKAQVREIIASRRKPGTADSSIDSIGPVKIYVELGSEFRKTCLLDTEYYDKEHATPAKGKAPVKTAEACIADLRILLESEKIQQQQELQAIIALQQQAQRDAAENRVRFSRCTPEKDDLVCRISPETSRVVTKNPGVTAYWTELESDVCSRCETIENGETRQVCYGEKTTFTEKYNKPQPTALSMLGASVFYAAVTAALSEAVGDTLELTGIASKANANRAKKATQLLMLYSSGYFVSLAAACSVSYVIRKTGLVSEENASRIGQAAGIAISAGATLLTPTGVAMTAVGFVSGKVGMFAEKKMVAAIQHRRRTNLPAFPQTPTSQV